MPLKWPYSLLCESSKTINTACISIKEQVSIDLSIGNKFLNLTLPLVLRNNGITVLQCRMGTEGGAVAWNYHAGMCKVPQGCRGCFHTSLLRTFALQLTASPLD